MTLDDSQTNGEDGPRPDSLNMDDALRTINTHDDPAVDSSIPDEAPLSIVKGDADSDYGGFGTDEEEILNDLLSKFPNPEAIGDAPLLVTDIEDYEEPRGVHLPKILGMERRTSPWLPQVRIQNQNEPLRDDNRFQGKSRCQIPEKAHLQPR